MESESKTPLQATGYQTCSSAVAKYLQAATWLVARGNKQMNGKGNGR